MPANVSEKSGVPQDWQRSDYYRKNDAKNALEKLFEVLMTKTRCVIMSYSDEGHVSLDELKEILTNFKVHVMTKEHARFSNTHDSKKRTAEGARRGSRWANWAN